jgi:hypothetical protein
VRGRVSTQQWKVVHAEDPRPVLVFSLLAKRPAKAACAGSEPRTRTRENLLSGARTPEEAQIGAVHRLNGLATGRGGMMNESH